MIYYTIWDTNDLVFEIYLDSKFTAREEIFTSLISLFLKSYSTLIFFNPLSSTLYFCMLDFNFLISLQ